MHPSERKARTRDKDVYRFACRRPPSGRDLDGHERLAAGAPDDSRAPTRIVALRMIRAVVAAPTLFANERRLRDVCRSRQDASRFERVAVERAPGERGRGHRIDGGTK